MSAPVERTIICEGYHDRAFWSGLLLSLGCTDPGVPLAGEATRLEVKDNAGKPIKGAGQFGFRTAGGHLIRVVPASGKSKIARAVKEQLDVKRRSQERIVVNVDSDQLADGSPAMPTVTSQTVLQAAQRADPMASLKGSQVSCFGGSIRIDLIEWKALDPASPSVPNQQCLERLVCSAIHEAYPARADAVRKWLSDRPGPPIADVKDFSWSHMAGWYAANGCDDFYARLWDDEKIRAAIEKRLAENGVSTLIDELVA